MSEDAHAPRSIVWLASYPKSGNTWLRAMLTRLMHPGPPLDLSALVGGPIADDRHAFDDYCGISSAEFSFAELMPYRSIFHYQLARENSQHGFIKTHNAYFVDRDGQALFKAGASAAAVYLVRNPLDVAVSFAHHSVVSTDTMIDRMADESAMLNQWPDRISPSLPIKLGSWSSHVESWIDQKDIPLLLVRYEDMLADPVESLERVVALAGMDFTRAQYQEAVEATRFERLQAIETEQGFKEKPVAARDFFRAGKSGGWRETLSSGQVERLVADHSAMMARLGYDRDVIGDE